MNRKTLGIIIAAVVVLGVGVGGTYWYLTQNNLNRFEQSVKSPENIVAEKYFPKDAILVASVNLNDAQTVQNWNTLLSRFPNVEELKTSFWQGFQNGMKTEEDRQQFQQVWPLFQAAFLEKPRVVVALGKGWNEASNSPDVYLALKVADKNAFQTFKEKMKTLPGASLMETSYASFTFLENQDKHFYGFLRGDVFFISNSRENVVDMADKSDEGKDGIFSDDNYRTVVANLETPGLGYMYLRFPDFMQWEVDMLGRLQPDMQDTASLKKMTESDAYKMLSGVGVSLAAKLDGLRFQSYVTGDRTVMDRLQYKFNSVGSHKPYLFQNLPAANTMLYTEAYNLQKAIGDSFRVNQFLTEQLTGGLDFVRAGLSGSLGIDLDKDFFALFDKGFSFSFQYESDNVMVPPQLTLMVDVKGKEASAAKVVQLIDSGVSLLMLQVQQALPDVAILAKTTAKIGGKEVQVVKADFSFLAENPQYPPAVRDIIKNLKFNLAYGVTGSGILLVSTRVADDLANMPASVAMEKNFSESLMRLPSNNNGLFYLDLSNILGYVDAIVKLVDQVEPLSDAEKASYTKIVNVLKPIQYFVSSSVSNDYDATSVGFLRIGE